MKSVKCRLRMLESIEKARKILSGDDQARINIEYLMADEDMVKTLTRQKFEEWIEPQVQKFTNFLIETLQKASSFYQTDISQ